MDKLQYIQSLLGKCPVGYEIEKYLAGGCVKCKRKAQELKCGGKPKKRITKNEEGATLLAKCGAKTKKK